MLGRKKKRYQNLSFAIDVVAGVILLQSLYLFLLYFSEALQPLLVSLIGYPFNLQGMRHLTENGWLFPVILLCLFLSLQMNRFYALDLFASKTSIILTSFKCALGGLCLSTLFFYFFSIANVNRSLLVGFFVIFFLYHLSKEFIFRQLLTRRWFRTHPLRAILVCSAREVSCRLDELKKRNLASVRVEQICLTEGDEASLSPELAPLVVGKSESLPSILAQSSVDVVFLTEQKGGCKITAREVIQAAEIQGVEVWYFADFLEPLLARPDFDEFGGDPVLVFSTVPHYEGRFLLKRLFDVFGAIFLLSLMSPLMLAIAVGIYMTSGGKGPVFFSQRRTGWRGKSFQMFKFRTMCEGAEDLRQTVLSKNEMDGPVFKAEDDPRITALGRWLRRYSLDELPQLWNVVRGEMSLVGPRPLPIYETEQFSEFKDRRRLSVLPGITGLWQVSGRSDIRTFSDWVRLDLEYIDRWSFGLDMHILLKTVPIVLAGQGAK